MEEALIVQALHRIIDLQEQILDQLKRGQMESAGNKNGFGLPHELLDHADIKRLLKISDRTFYRIKKSNALQTIKIGNKMYFKLDEVKKILGEG